MMDVLIVIGKNGKTKNIKKRRYTIVLSKYGFVPSISRSAYC